MASSHGAGGAQAHHLSEFKERYQDHDDRSSSRDWAGYSASGVPISGKEAGIRTSSEKKSSSVCRTLSTGVDRTEEYRDPHGSIRVKGNGNIFENHALREWARRRLISLEGLIAPTLFPKGCMASWLSWHEVEVTSSSCGLEKAAHAARNRYEEESFRPAL